MRKMQPGTYKAVCEATRLTNKWGKQQVEMAFRIAEGEHFGTHLPGWFTVLMAKDVVFPCQYLEQCAVVLGHEVSPGDDVDPETLFVGKVFSVTVRLAKTNGKERTFLDPNRNKTKSDFLRVGPILGLAEL